MSDYFKVLATAAQALASFGDSSFPDAAFIIEKGADKKDGKTVQAQRHLPHHRASVKSPTENGSVDLAHLRNALARANQVKPVKESAATFHAKALSHLHAHARVLLKTDKSNADIRQIMTEFNIPEEGPEEATNE